VIDLANPTDGRARDTFGRVWVTTARGAAEVGITEAAIRDWTRRRLVDGQLVDGRRWYRLDQLQTLEAAAYRRAQARSTAVVDDQALGAAQSGHHHADLLTNRAQMSSGCIIDTEEDGPCPLPVPEDSRWQICESHIGDIYYACRNRERRTPPEAATPPPAIKRPTQPTVSEYVYYLIFADRVKIGYSSNLKLRLTQLPYDEVLAVEPGGHDLEQLRHTQFAVARIYTNREWFVFTDELRSHCAMLVQHYGKPQRYLLAAA
jgi:hypothetical protein